MEKIRKNKVQYLIVFMVTIVLLIGISATVLGAQFDKPTKPTIQPKIVEPGMGHPMSDWDGYIEPLGCRDPSAFHDCFNSLGRYCPGALERDGGSEACYSNAYDQCFRTYCSN